MKTIKDIRINAGFSERDMAGYLGISRAMLVNAEANMRSLNLSCLEKIGRIEMILREMGEPDVKDQLVITEEYNDRVESCRYEAAIIQKKLNEMQLSYKKALRTNEVLQRLAATIVDDRPTWYNVMKVKTADVLRICSQVKQERLREQIFLLTAEAGYLSDTIEKTKSL